MTGRDNAYSMYDKVCVRGHVCVCTCTCMCACAHMYAGAYMRVCVHACVHAAVGKVNNTLAEITKSEMIIKRYCPHGHLSWNSYTYTEYQSPPPATHTHTQTKTYIA